MRRDNKRRHSIDMMFPVTILFVFAILAVTVLVLAANIYSSNNRREQVSEKEYTPLLYITEKVRQNEGPVTVSKIGEDYGLVLHSMIDDKNFCTYIYYYDGFLRELFMEDGIEIKPDFGQEILRIDGFKTDIDENGIIKINVFDEDGNSRYIYLQDNER